VGFVEIDPVKNKLLALGVGGTILATLCCFTPLLPILAGFLILTGYALWRQKQQK
jgi:thiol:disulfide interchange protein